MPRTLDADVAIVGASLAGCAAAIHLGRAGARVALLERSPDPDAYKRLCGHYIQAGATPELERLGLAAGIEAAGGVRNGVDVRTPWGWIRRPGTGHGYSIRRTKLDPLIRRRALATPGVTYVPGVTADGLLRDGARIAGVTAHDRDRRGVAVRARLVVGADGRTSAVARLAGVPAVSAPNERWCAFAYYEGLDEPGRIWRLGRDVVLAVPNDDGLTVLAVFAHRAAPFSADPARIAAAVAEVPDAPPVRRARLVSKVLGYRDYPNLWRAPAPRPGLALVGDAATSIDPAPAIGCGWALQSAGWLAGAVAPALAGGEDLDAALGAYAAEHERWLGGHRRLVVAASRAEPPGEPEIRLARAAVHDPGAARLFFGIATRSAPLEELLARVPA